MKHILHAACLAVLLLDGVAGAAEVDLAARDEQTLRDAKLGTDAPALLEFFRRRTLKDVDPTQVKELIKQLGDDSFGVRERASGQLVVLGRPVVAHLKDALKDPDIEVVRRAEECIRRIGEGSAGALVDSAARLLAVRKSPEAAEVLLAYLPYAEDETSAHEVRQAIAAVAMRDGKIDPSLTTALGDKLAARRAAAVLALARTGLAEHRPTVEKMLQDVDAGVRLRAALALAENRERKAIPILIDLLVDLPTVQLGQALGLLQKLAGEQTPTVLPGADAASRRKYRDAWAEWWTKHGEKIDLAKVEPPVKPHGFTLIVLLDQGRVLELDEKNQERWRIDGLQFPLDVQMLANDRLLTAEQAIGRVTERNLKGEIVWQKQVADPLVAQRLPNGNTLIINRTQLFEIDRDGKELLTHTASPGEQFMRGRRLPNGEIILVIQALDNSTSRFVRLDPTAAAELQSFPVEVHTFGGRFEVLPNGNVLIPQLRNNRVVEQDARGRIIWDVTVDQPIVASRLPNGNTLVTSMTENRAIELDRQGKMVWDYRSDTRVTRAYRR